MLAPMHLGDLTPVEQRVLGCLIEKRWTTPDQYPLSLNALRLACNQLTNRDPVTDYDEASVREAAYRLSRYGLTRMASGHGNRAVKYRHLAEEGLSLGRDELAILAVEHVDPGNEGLGRRSCAMRAVQGQSDLRAFAALQTRPDEGDRATAAASDRHVLATHARQFSQATPGVEAKQ